MAQRQRNVRFLTNDAYVVLALARWPDLTVRELAGLVGITERATYTLLGELERAGYLDRRRAGKLAVDLRLDMPLPHRLLSGRRLRDLTALVTVRTMK